MPSRRRNLAGEPIRNKLTNAPGNNAPIGGLKVVADSARSRPGPPAPKTFTKCYAESFRDQAHLDAIVSEAQEIVDDALKSSDASP